jgi:hypothetical protein
MLTQLSGEIEILEVMEFSSVEKITFLECNYGMPRFLRL